jgi:hypothetical protein
MELEELYAVFANHGCFIGGKHYVSIAPVERMTNPRTTPFARLYLDPHARRIAARVRGCVDRTGVRLIDPLKLLRRRADTVPRETGLFVYDCSDPKRPPVTIEQMDETNIPDSYLRLV